MKIKVDFTNKNIIQVIRNNFPFATVHRLMDVTRWRYYDSNNTPSIDRIKETLCDLLKSVKSGECIGTGGFDVHLKDGNYNIKFTIATFCFTQKSTEWEYEDLSYLKKFIDKIEKTEVILSSALAMLRNGGKDLFFARECDQFIDSGLNENYLSDLGLLYTKESEGDDDHNPVYNVSFIGVDKDFKI